jgi:fermentation-respiration switch protein FrsA (DUF1100 family)
MQIKLQKAEAIAAHILYTVSYNKFTFSRIRYENINLQSINMVAISRTGTTVAKVDNTLMFGFLEWAFLQNKRRLQCIYK